MSTNKWHAENVPDQKGRIVIITGSSSGIGYETARVLADKNATVIIAVRNLKKGDAAADKIRKAHSHANLHVMALDLANLTSVRTFVDEFRIKFDRLDLLINNAGVMIPPYSKTADGFELQFGTNHLGHFALTGLLMDLLLKTSGSRIVNVSSGAHKYGTIDFSDLAWETRKYKPWKAYGDSKIANLYFTFELARRLKSNKQDVIVAAAHPGWTATDLQRHSGFIEYLNSFFAQGIEMGALPTLYAAVGPDVQSGDYYGPSGFIEMRGFPKKVSGNALSQDKAIAGRLWEVSENLTGVTPLVRSAQTT
ncbi:MAG: SDR family NAD(P)-dependent oxidoreductase [candidate division Zixibacteria bacterium]|nr:SDR family NAD(P)-dependent oxidoreductase [candidate division Zixibacteria bacterium]